MCGYKLLLFFVEGNDCSQGKSCMVHAESYAVNHHFRRGRNALTKHPVKADLTQCMRWDGLKWFWLGDFDAFRDQFKMRWDEIIYLICHSLFLQRWIEREREEGREVECGGSGVCLTHCANSTCNCIMWPLEVNVGSNIVLKAGSFQNDCWIWFVIRVYCDGRSYCCCCIFSFCVSLCVFLCVGSLLLRAAQSSVFNLWFPVALRGWCSHNCAGKTGSHHHNPFTHTHTNTRPKITVMCHLGFPSLFIIDKGEERKGVVGTGAFLFWSTEFQQLSCWWCCCLPSRTTV